MKYLEGSKFTVHVGSSAYSEGWDRIFGTAKSAEHPTSRGERVPETIASTPDGCFNCEYVHAAWALTGRCSCICHALDVGLGPAK